MRRLPLLLCAMCAACPSGDSKGGPKGRPPPLVQVERVRPRDVPVEIRAPVDLRPLVQADLGAKTLGYLDTVLVDRGDLVKKGQLLAFVRPSDLPDKLAASKSSYAQAQASAALARANFERAQKLAPRGVVSQAELQQATTQAAAAEAAAEAARSQMGALGTQLGESRIESPLDGVVISRRVDPGALVGPATGPILTVARTDQMRVFLAVNEREATQLAVGKPARVEVDALPDKSFEGQVVRLSPGFDATTRTLEAEIHLDNREGLLRPGMYGRAAVLIETHKDAIVVPVTAVQISNEHAFVFVVGDDGKAHRKPVKLGVDGGDWLEVREGLSAGDPVVVLGIDALAEGAQVRVAGAGGPDAGVVAAKPPGGTPP
jgi:membrane fusion protein (multidrug efflux system)